MTPSLFSSQKMATEKKHNNDKTVTLFSHMKPARLGIKHHIIHVSNVVDYYGQENIYMSEI